MLLRKKRLTAEAKKEGHDLAGLQPPGGAGGGGAGGARGVTHTMLNADGCAGFFGGETHNELCIDYSRFKRYQDCKFYGMLLCSG